MPFFVSTTHRLLAVDPEDGSVWQVHTNNGLYFGLTKGPDSSIYVACRNSTTGPEDEAARSRERGSVLVFDSRYRFSREFTAPFPLRDVHGMEYFDGRLWLTCSFDNMVAIYDIARDEWTRWYPAPNPAHRDQDIHHFNTVRFRDNRVWLVAHCFGASYLLAYDYPSLELHSVLPLGHMAHDLLSYRGELATCSSGEGCIVNVRQERLRTGNFPRGAAQSESGHLLGMSVHADRGQRAAQSGILRWYSSDWNFRADYVLPGAGMVLDVMAVEASREALDALPSSPAEIICGSYNRLHPGNVYDLAKIQAGRGFDSLEWHEPESGHRWTAAREASMLISISPGETLLDIEANSAYPVHYLVHVLLDGQWLGDITFLDPGSQRAEFDVSRFSAGEHRLEFRVPHLWKPAAELAGNTDPRTVGIAIRSVSLHLPQAAPVYSS